jgi:type I restriction enzyme S subunit
MIAHQLKTVPIGDHTDSVLTWNPARESKEETFQYVDLSSIDQSEKEIIPNGRISVRDAPSRARQLIKEGDILVSTVRPNLNGVAYVPPSLDGATASTGFCVLRPKNKDLDGRYLFHWVRTPQFVADMVKKATGQSYPAVSDRIVKDSLIPLPPLAEQRRIAAILDQADALRRARRRAIARLNDLGQAVFYEMFGDPATNPKGWQTEELGSLCNLVRGSSPRPQGDPRYFGGSVPRLMIADITRDGMYVTPSIDSLTEAGALLSRPMPAGSVVMAVSGAVGLTAILSKDACIHDGFVGFRELDERILPEFLYYYLVQERERNRSQGVGAIWINLTTDQVKRFKIFIPPKKVQEDFCSKLYFVNKNREIYQIASLKTETLFSSLQQRAFRGEL